MKNRKKIRLRKSEKHFRRTIKSKKRRKLKKGIRFVELAQLNKIHSIKNFLYESFDEDTLKWLPSNLSFLVYNDKCDFHIDKLRSIVPTNNDGTFEVPERFSIIDKPNESYKFLQEVTAALLFQSYSSVILDYKFCIHVDLGAQVFLDIIIKDVLYFIKKLRRFARPSRIQYIGAVNINHENVRKLLFSVGSPSIHSNNSINFKEIIPYKLCIHDRGRSNPLSISNTKAVDTTTLADYVIDCLKRFGKSLSPEKLDNLCTVIGEILINAEEHSTTKYRFSIGYFHEITEATEHTGLFRLVILNLGKTIYEKFKDPDCPNKEVVEKMTKTSNSYRFKDYFTKKKFEEETLWTLYSLQQGITSIAPELYRKRGNGSIQFIESFFNLRGDINNNDKLSRMTIQSGNTTISFDGSYEIKEKVIDGENFKVMTFNDSGEIEEKPDPDYVKFAENYFPGTIISARILFNEDDFTNETK